MCVQLAHLHCIKQIHIGKTSLQVTQQLLGEDIFCVVELVIRVLSTRPYPALYGYALECAIHSYLLSVLGKTGTIILQHSSQQVHSLLKLQPDKMKYC